MIRAAALVLAFALGAASAGARPLGVLWREPSAREVPDRMLVLVVAIDERGVVLQDARVAAGAPKLRRGAAPASADLELAVRDAGDAPLLACATTVPWVVHGDEPLADGSLRGMSVRRGRAVLALRLPVLEGATWLTFHPRSETSGAASRPAEAPELGRIDLAPLLP